MYLVDACISITLSTAFTNPKRLTGQKQQASLDRPNCPFWGAVNSLSEIDRFNIQLYYADTHTNACICYSGGYICGSLLLLLLHPCPAKLHKYIHSILNTWKVTTIVCMYSWAIKFTRRPRKERLWAEPI